MWKYRKYAAVALILYAIIGGLLLPAPRLAILHETIRNLHYHVPMWFGMVALLGASVYFGIRHLMDPQHPRYDVQSVACAHTGMLFGVLGMVTGMIWAQYTWGSWWSGDPKQNAAAVAMLIYLAYFLLRSSLEDELQRSRISAIYNIFAYSAFLSLIFVLPRLTDSLHPGNGGNPGFNAYDLDSRLRIVFYPAVIGWILLGSWLVELRVRLRLLEARRENL